eukprot:6020058-Amphidinium_carterae.1
MWQHASSTSAADFKGAFTASPESNKSRADMDSSSSHASTGESADEHHTKHEEPLWMGVTELLNAWLPTAKVRGGQAEYREKVRHKPKNIYEWGNDLRALHMARTSSIPRHDAHV